MVELLLFDESLVASEFGLLAIPLSVEGDDLCVGSSFSGLLCAEVEVCEFPGIEGADKSFEF